MIFVRKLDDACVKTVFKKDICKMVQGALVLVWGVRVGTLYKLQGSTIVDGCNSSVVPESGAENLVVLWRKDHAVASKAWTYWREGPLNTSW